MSLKINYKVKSLFTDSVFILLFLNMLWVILSYAFATSFGLAVVGGIRIFKITFLVGSLIYVLYKNGINTSLVSNKLGIYLVLFAVSLTSFLAAEPFKALYRSLTFVYPLVYVLYSINYLLRYEALNLLLGLSVTIFLVYSIVPLSFYLVGGDLDSSGIYGYTEGDYFVSNHYGWGSALFLLSGFTLLKLYPMKFFQKLIIYSLFPLVFYLLIISANRAGILSVLLASMLFLFKDKEVNFGYKIVLISVSFTIVLVIFLQDNSVIDFIVTKNEIQLETGAEGRLIGTNAMLNSFNNNPVYWLTGVGMFNYVELKLNGGILGAYHNSYWEILFGSGVIVFIVFLWFMIIHPFKIFWRITTNYSLLFIPLLLIPFFESNLTAGQFLFFPWFAYMILLNSKELNFYATKRHEQEVKS